MATLANVEMSASKENAENGAKMDDRDWLESLGSVDLTGSKELAVLVDRRARTAKMDRLDVC